MAGHGAQQHRRAAAKSTGGVAEGATQAREMVSRITAEQLVGTLTGEHDLDVLPGETAEDVQRYGVRVAQRLVVVMNEPLKGLLEQTGSRHDDVMLGTGPSRRVASQRGLIPRGIIEPDREGLEAARPAGGIGGDEA